MAVPEYPVKNELTAALCRLVCGREGLIDPDAVCLPGLRDALAAAGIGIDGKRTLVRGGDEAAARFLAGLGACIVSDAPEILVQAGNGDDQGLAGTPAVVADLRRDSLRTPLIYDAKRAGLRTVSGMEALAFGLVREYCGREDAPAAAAALARLYRQYRNIVLTGIPTAGKTTFGGLVSQRTGRELVEMDDEIIRIEGMPVTEIFSRYGEERFRETESQIIKVVSSRYGLVISCGGGVVKKEENMRDLAKNGLILWIDRDPSLLYGSLTRPLAASDAQVRKLYHERKPLYAGYADVRIENNETIEACLAAVLQAAGEI